MKGIRVLEVAQFTFVPAAGALLADWGADVVKVEHPVRGDTQRGFLYILGRKIDPKRNTVMEHPNRGKRSIGIDISTRAGQELIYELARTADVFLTNYLPSARQKLRIDLEHIRAVNPQIIYARGSAHGDKGPERDIGGFDATAFWSRGGIGESVTPAELDGPILQCIPAFGDSISGMNLAGGIAAALLHRERTGEAAEVDVSLLSSSWWATGAGVDQALESGLPPEPVQLPRSGGIAFNPFVGNFRTSDGRSINLCILTPGPCIRDTFEHLGVPEAAEDPRFSDAERLMENWEAGSEVIKAAFAQRPFAYWCDRLRTLKGQWAPLQNLLDLSRDEQALANDMVFEVEAIDGGRPIRLVRGPVQFDHAPVRTTRAPQAAEHTETILLEAGLTWEQILELKDTGAVA